MGTYLLRHGETEWNKVGRKQGRGDSALTSVGEAQAIDCAEILNKHINEPHAMVVSPLGRAQETADIIDGLLKQQLKCKITVNELAEHDYGLWQGLTDQDIDSNYPGERKKRYKNHWEYQIEQGESYAMVERRVCRWSEKADLSFKIIVAHEIVNRVLIGCYLGLSKTETLKLSHPHGTVYQLIGNSISALTVDKIWPNKRL